MASALGPKILGSKCHIVTLFTWIVWRTYATAEVHSGYELAFSPVRMLPFASNFTHLFEGSSYSHDFHHSKNVGNFGSFFTWWDHIMGTDQPFIEYHYLKRKID